ncbi:MAG: RNA polymerase subunit sigma-70 [Bacteroidia bacterium 43-41]|nr:MAG: RNA polymerase subunit sigma-70 [Bacteroidia bacterium 43-41]
MNSFSPLQNFNNLFNEYYDRFIRFAWGYVKEKEVAEDFVSEAFTIYWENREDLLPDTKAQAYILTIIKNKCLNYLQHIQVRQRAEKEINDHAEWLLSTRINTLQACDPDFIFSDEIQKIVESTLDKLPPRTRQIFILNRYQGLSYQDIANQMDLSIKTIEFHISKALAQLRFSLKDFICLSLFLFYFY